MEKKIKIAFALLFFHEVKVEMRSGERTRRNAWIINYYAAIFYILRLAVVVRAETLVWFRTEKKWKKSTRKKVIEMRRKNFAISIKFMRLLVPLSASATKLKRFSTEFDFLSIFVRVRTFWGWMCGVERSKYLSYMLLHRMTWMIKHLYFYAACSFQLLVSFLLRNTYV